MSRVDTPEKNEVAQKGEDNLSQLIAEQGVTPIDDLRELAALWPADDDPDALMNFVLSERQARLQLNAEDQHNKLPRSYSTPPSPACYTQRKRMMRCVFSTRRIWKAKSWLSAFKRLPSCGRGQKRTTGERRFVPVSKSFSRSFS